MDKILELYNSTLAFFGPSPYLKALGVLLIFGAIGLIFNFIVIRLLKRVISKTPAHGMVDAFNYLSKPVFVTFILIALVQSARVLQMPESYLAIVIAILRTIAIYIWVSFALKASKFTLNVVCMLGQEQRLLQKSTLPLFQNFANIFIIAIAIYFMFLVWGINVSAWVASAGILGVGISFAAKDTLANLFAGVFIVADSPYKVDDTIQLETGERGRVTHIGIRSTRIMTLDDVEITIPNSIMGNTMVTNIAGGPSAKHRIQIPVGVAYGSNIDQVRTLLLQICIDNQTVCQDPQPLVQFKNMGASSLDFVLQCWVEVPSKKESVIDEINTAVYNKLNEAGIEIPYSKQDVYIKSMPQS
jgi:small-conductance mechanosensitive channel